MLYLKQQSFLLADFPIELFFFGFMRGHINQGRKPVTRDSAFVFDNA